MPDALNTALLFLINTLFDLYLFVLMVRLLLVYVGASYYDQVTQFVVKLTNGLVNPLRRFLPNMRRIETATLVCIILIEYIKFFFIGLLTIGMPNLLGLWVLAIADSFKLLLLTFTYAIILEVILSWIQNHSPLNKTLNDINAPIMRPLQRFIPPIAGIDFSPLFAIIILQVIIILIINPFIGFGIGMAFT